MSYLDDRFAENYAAGVLAHDSVALSYTPAGGEAVAGRGSLKAIEKEAEYDENGRRVLQWGLLELPISVVAVAAIGDSVVIDGVTWYVATAEKHTGVHSLKLKQLDSPKASANARYGRY